MRILLVEDTAATSEVLAEILADEGHEVEVAADGRQALDALRERRPDLMLLDLMLPRVTGWEVLADPLAAGVRTLVLTAAYLHPEDASALGAPVMIKPIRMEQLLAWIDAEPPMPNS